MPLARKRNMKGLDDLVRALRARRDEGLAREVTEAMTTNESFFFRDIKPFDLFRNTVLPGLRESRAGTRSIRIWSAAASSGQEPYTIAMVLKEEAAKFAGWRIEILATDISSDMLAKARAGVYSQFEVQRGLPITLLVKYFRKHGVMWQIDPSLRAMVRYQEHSLLHDFRPLGTFDVVFCRNVLIYFDPENQGAGAGRHRPGHAPRRPFVRGWRRNRDRRDRPVHAPSPVNVASFASTANPQTPRSRNRRLQAPATAHADGRAAELASAFLAQMLTTSRRRSGISRTGTLVRSLASSATTRLFAGSLSAARRTPKFSGGATNTSRS